MIWQQSRTLLDCASDRACSGNAGGIGQAGWQGLQWPLRWGSIERLPQLPLLQLMQQQLGICVPVLLPNRIVGLQATLKLQSITKVIHVEVQSIGNLPCHQLMLPLHWQVFLTFNRMSMCIMRYITVSWSCRDNNIMHL